MQLTRTYALAIGVGILVLVGIFVGLQSESRQEPIRIGINRWPGDEFLFLAQQKGFFAEEGADVRILEFSSLGDVRRAYEHGQIDMASITLIELLQVRDHTPLRPNILLIQDFSNGGDVVLARAEIPDVAGLKGKKVGVEAASLSMFMLERALDKEGLSISDITAVPMDQSSMAQSMAEGQVDAVVTYPPAMNQVLAVSKAHTVFTSADIPGEVVDVVVAERAFLERRAPEIQAILRAWDRAIAFEHLHPDEAHPIMAAREQLTVPEFRAALSGVQPLSIKDQRPLFEPGGVLSKSLTVADRVLRRANELSGPDSTGDCIPPEALRLP